MATVVECIDKLFGLHRGRDFNFEAVWKVLGLEATRIDRLTNRIESLEKQIGFVKDEGNAETEVHWLDGLRVQCIRDGETGTVQKVWLNRNQQRVQIVVKMDSWGVRCFLPHQLSIHTSSF